MNTRALRERQAQWERFHAWESQKPPGPSDVRSIWQWYEEAWQVARESGRIARVPQVDLDKVRRI